MAVLNLPTPYGEIDDLIERDDLEAARSALRDLRAAVGASLDPELRELLDVKLALADRSIPTQLAMNRLLALMRKNPNLAGAHELYRQASDASYGSGESSMAHSHPPPPIKPRQGK